MLEFLFYKVASFQGCNAIKKKLLHRYFPMKYENFLKTLILKNICERLLLCISYIDLYNSLQYTFFIFTNNFFSITQLNNRTNDSWGGFFWRSISQNEVFSFWKPKISFAEVFHESLKNQFNWNLMLRYTVKLTLN